MRTEPPAPHDVPDLPAFGLLEGLAQLHQTLFVVDDDGRILWLSGELGAWSGHKQCLVGRDVRELFGTDERHVAIRRQLDRDGSVANERIEVIRSDGRPVPVEISCVPVSAARGERRLFLAIVRPADRGDAARREVHETADYLHAILDSSPEAVLAVDRRGYVTYANPALERLLGERLDRLVDKPVTLVFSRRAELEAVAGALHPGAGSETLEFRLTGSGSEEGARIVSIATSRLCLPDGSHAGTVAFLRDVTAERRFEDALARKNAELEHYVHAVSHDLRTPLVSLLGFSRLLAQDYGDVLTDTGRHFLERIEQASRTMEALINDLLELSRIGRSEAQRELVDPLAVLKQLVHELKPRLEGASIELHLPESPPLLLCVRTQLYQVFSNLIGNAIQHMGECESPRIEVGVAQDAEGHVICVRDNGAGVPPGHQERVFEVFHTVSRKPGGRRGTGIGLAIVKKIAEAHGGRVWLESEPGRGAAFFLSLPR